MTKVMIMKTIAREMTKVMIMKTIAREIIKIKQENGDREVMI
jgi:hypothetical protein